ncbi:MAG: hypothetical protein PHD25_10200 [Bacteroidales bacterium]|nr:hypothetical protein [Bacteroidales bacterium]
MNQVVLTSEKELVPTLGSAFRHGWVTMINAFLELFLVLLILIAVTIPFWPISTFEENIPAIVMLQIFAMVYGLMVVAPFDYGAKYMYVKAVRGEKLVMKDILKPFDDYLNVILANLLTGAIIIFGFFLLIIPGILFAVKLSFVPYLVMEKKLDPVEAVKTSWNMTYGVSWTIFWMAIVSFFIYIAGLICLLIGVLFSSIWVSVSFAAIYHAQNKLKNPVVADVI